MLIIGDARMPARAIDKLSLFGKFIPFKTNHLVYEAVSGHPDLFFCPVNDQWVVAPNTPEKYKKLFVKENIKVQTGENIVGKTYPQTARYNAVLTDQYLIHHQKYTDTSIKLHTAGKTVIHVKQAYTRCNLLPLSLEKFITSDEGIYKTLLKSGLEVHYFSPRGILLPGFSNGFLGGCCGIYENRVFIIGQLKFYAEGGKLRKLLQKLNYEIVELYAGPLFDGGSLFFVP